MKNFIRFCCVVVFSIFTITTYAQKIEGFGKVLDKETNSPLPGATIVIKDSSNGVTSDFDGNFKIKSSLGDVLVVSYIGYNSIEVVRFVVHRSVASRVEALGLLEWRLEMSNSIDGTLGDDRLEEEEQIKLIHSKLAKYELKEATALLELALCKRKNEEAKQAAGERSGMHTRKRAKVDREHSRIDCGSDVVIANILPFFGKVLGEE